MGAPSTPGGGISNNVPPPWPRGLPLGLIRQPCNVTLEPAGGATISAVAVVQSLADHDPDVDAIFRLTRGVPFDFDPANKKSLIIPQGTLAPWNAQATLVLKQGFWSLLLPTTVISDMCTERLCRIAFSADLQHTTANLHSKDGVGCTVRLLP
jgi:hypothetical protein